MIDFEWQIATQSHRGNVRKSNEDSLCVKKQYPLMVVADGMGGHAAGEVASQMLVNKLGALSLPATFSAAIDQISSQIRTTNVDIRDYAAANLEGRTIGTTVVAMLVDGGQGACLWAGDSRLYRYRGGSLEQLSEDHSVVADMVRNGELTPEEAAKHPSSNVITRAVGASAQLSVDVKQFAVEANDIYLLCTDGLYNEVSEREIAELLASEDVFRCSEQLLRLCLERPARDNVSFVIGRAAAMDASSADATLTYFPE